MLHFLLAFSIRAKSAGQHFHLHQPDLLQPLFRFCRKVDEVKRVPVWLVLDNMSPDEIMTYEAYSN